MLKFLILTSCNAAVSMTSLDEYVGIYVPVYIIPSKGARESCFDMTVSLHTDKFKCKCNEAEVPTMEFKSSGSSFFSSIILVGNYSDVNPALNQTCTCDGATVTPAVIMPINSNFFILNTREGHSRPDVVILFAKREPSRAVLDNMLKTVEALKNKSGDLLCTTETNFIKDTNTKKVGEGGEINRISDFKPFFQAS